jgi:hypothetical protein
MRSVAGAIMRDHPINLKWPQNRHRPQARLIIPV